VIHHRLDLREFSSTNLANAEIISLRFEISDSSTPVGRLKSAPIQVDDLRLISTTGGNQYSAPRKNLHSGDLVELRRVSQGTNAAAGTNAFSLSFRTTEPVSVRLRCNGGAATRPEDFRRETWPGTLAIDVAPHKGDPANLRRWAFPQGSYSVASPVAPLSRCELLRQWWGLPSQSWWWVGFSLSSLLVWGSCFVWQASSAWTNMGSGSRGEAMAIFSLSLALSVDFALITPPLQGPDEPSHLVSILRWRGTPEHVTEFQRFGLRAHAVRLTNRPEQKFATADLDAPLDWFVFSVGNMDSNVPMRSALAARVWAVAWWMFGSATLPKTLMLFRLFSAFTISLFVGIAAALSGPGKGRALSIGLLLLAPSVTWFAMTVSNWAFALGLGVLAVGSLVRITGGRRDAVAGLALGSAMGLALQNSATLIAWVAGLVATLIGLSARRRTGENHGGSSSGESMGFWAAIALSVGASSLVATPEHNALMATWGSKVLRYPLPSDSWWLLWWGGAASAGMLGFGFEWLSNKLTGGGHPKTLVSLPGSLPHWLRWLPLASILLWQGWIAVSPSPQLPPMKEALPSWEFQARLRLPSMGSDNWNDTGWRLTGWSYVARTAAAVFGSFGIGDHDYLTSVLFWSYLGYNDVWLPDSAISVMVGLFVLGLIGWTLPSKRTLPGFDKWTAFCWVLGACCCLVLTASASAFSEFSPSIHGRYLIPFYVTVLGLCSLGAIRHVERWSLDLRKVWLGLVCVVIAVHHYCLGSIAQRYF
jgi:hypothetical protein